MKAVLELWPLGWGVHIRKMEEDRVRMDLAVTFKYMVDKIHDERWERPRQMLDEVGSKSDPAQSQSNQRSKVARLRR